MKFIVTMIVSSMLFGCASSSSVSALSDKVSHLEGKYNTMQAEIDSLKETDVKQDSELGDINNKLDRLLSKKK